MLKAEASLFCETCKRNHFQCSCVNNWDQFDSILASECSGVTTENIQSTYLKVSTMTICCKFNKMLNLKNLKENAHPGLKINFRPESKKSGNSKQRGSESFYNSLDIKMTLIDYTKNPIVPSNVSIMIFPNGQVKIAGCKTITLFPLVIQELTELLTETPGTVDENIEPSVDLEVNNCRIVMICSDFVIKPQKDNMAGWCLRQENLKNILNNNYEATATFSSLSKYPGINVKYPSKVRADKKISLLIFRSGSIIITGAADIKELVDSYRFINEVVNTHSQEVFYWDQNEEFKKKKIKKSPSSLIFKKKV